MELERGAGRGVAKCIKCGLVQSRFSDKYVIYKLDIHDRGREKGRKRQL